MAFTVTGIATVSDVRDGISPPTIYLTNENHTFVASSAGVVADFSGFTTTAQVFVGSSQYTYAASSPSGTQFTYGNPTVSSGADLDVEISSGGVITISDAGTTSVTGFADAGGPTTATITIPVTVAGFTSAFSRVISLSKALGGSAPLVRVEANTQTVLYNAAGAPTTTDNIVVSANEINFESAGVIAFTYRSGATGAFTALTGAGITIDNTASPETATITPAAYNTLLGSNRTVTIRATRGTVYDQITIARINDGEAAITVIVSVTSGSLVLRSDSDSVVLRADVYQGGTLQTPGADWTYAWSKDTTALTSGNQTTMTGATQLAGEGHDQRSLRIEGDGITDGESSLFSVVVTDPT